MWLHACSGEDAPLSVLHGLERSITRAECMQAVVPSSNPYKSWGGDTNGSMGHPPHGCKSAGVLT